MMISRESLIPKPEGWNPKRALILTGGGDAPGLNAVIRAFVHAATAGGLEVLGSEDGFEGLVQDRIVKLTGQAVRGILPQGGSILGCSNRSNPWSYPMKGKDGTETFVDVSEQVIARLKTNNVDVVVLVGGDGTMHYANKFIERGLNVVGIPKTIDNDLGATDLTFGFDTAVTTATWAIDALHSTAAAHDRVMILELMGRYAGWITLCSGIAGGADVVLIPEIPYDVDRVMAKVRGRPFSIIVIGEGAKPRGGDIQELAPGNVGHLPRLGGAGQQLAAQLEGKIDHEVRVTVLGHLQRGGSPTQRDRQLGTRFGVKAAELCLLGRVGRMVSLQGTAITSVPIADVTTGQPKLVPPEGELVRTARSIGIELGA